MTQPPVLLTAPQRLVVDNAINNVCYHNDWDLYALYVGTNHVHAVISAACTPEKISVALKAWATRALREAQLIHRTAKVWAHHGSMRYLWNQEAIRAASDYTLEGQIH
jgi:REP element-mobilizing transposase RayT